MMFRICGVLLGLGLCLPGFSVRAQPLIIEGANASPIMVQSETPEVDEAFLRANLQQMLARFPRVPGFMVAIQAPGEEPEVVAEGYARINPPSSGESVALTGNEHFRIASISKFYTATAIMRLREQGFLSLTNTVADLAPELNAPRAAEVTVDLLLSHRSGMGDAGNSQWFQNLFMQDPFRVYSVEELVASLAHLHPNLLFEPGTDYAYSDTGYSILGRIIENVSGTTYQSFLRTELLDPLGLTNTFVPFNNEYDVPAPAMAQYATANGVFGDWSRYAPSLEFGCGSIMANMHDLMHFAHAVLATTNVLNDASRALMMDPIAGGFHGRGASYIAGLGWGHGGNAWGMNSYVAVDTNNGVVVAAANNGMEYDQPDRLLNAVLALYSGMGLAREMQGLETPGIWGAKPPYSMNAYPSSRQTQEAVHTFVTGNFVTNWTVLSGLPEGLTLDAATGVISGAATTTGVYEMVVLAQNPFGTVTNEMTYVVETGYTNTIATIRERIIDMMAAEGTVGVSIALVDDQEIVWSEGFGWADREAGIPVTTGTSFRIGSISKAFAAATALQYAERGLVDIHAPFTNYVQEAHWRARYTGTRPITSFDLMTHHSGLPGDLIRAGFLSAPLDRGYANTLHDLAGTYPVLPPGTLNNYCNVGFVLLEGVIEAAAASEGDHRSFTELVDARLFAPLGMHASSYLFDKPGITQHLARPYQGDERVPEEFVEIHGTGSMYSSPTDLAKFMMAIFSDDAIVLRPETLTFMLEDHSTNALYDAFIAARTGLGWDTVTDPRFDPYGVKAAWKSGGTMAYSAMLTILPDPEHKLGVAILASSRSSIPAVLHTLTLQHALAERDNTNLFAEITRPLAGVVTPPPQSELDAFAGFYAGAAGYDKIEAHAGSLTYVEDVLNDAVAISNLTLRADGWYASDDEPTFLIAFTNAHGRDLVRHLNIEDGIEFPGILSERFTPTGALSAAWSNRLDRTWIARNAPVNDYLPLLGLSAEFYLRQSEGVLYIASGGFLAERVLAPETDTLAWTVGLLNRNDSAVQVEIIDGIEHLRYAGYLFGPEPAEVAVATTLSGAITREGFSSWYAITPAPPAATQGAVSNLLYEVELRNAPAQFLMRVYDEHGVDLLAGQQGEGRLVIESTSEPLLLRIQPDVDGPQTGTFDVGFSVPVRIREIERTGGGSMVWQGPAGDAYTVESATELGPENTFVPLAAEIVTTDLLHSQPLNFEEPQQFFRISE
jgi:CubicO group peptidase (beta-lactamase class C family)